MKLDVYMGALPVGWLSHDSASNQFAFDYCPDWLLSPTAFPLAPTLPLASIPDQTADSHSRAVRVFFENLLRSAG